MKHACQKLHRNPQPYHVSLRYSIKKSKSVQCIPCPGVLVPFSIPPLDLGSLRFFRSCLNWAAWRRAWSGSWNTAESHRSPHRSFHVVPSSSLHTAWQRQRMAIRLGPSFPQRPRRGSPIQTCGSWTLHILHCTLGLAIE